MHVASRVARAPLPQPPLNEYEEYGLRVQG